MKEASWYIICLMHVNSLFLRPLIEKKQETMTQEKKYLT